MFRFKFLNLWCAFFGRAAYAPESMESNIAVRAIMMSLKISLAVRLNTNSDAVYVTRMAFVGFILSKKVPREGAL